MFVIGNLLSATASVLDFLMQALIVVLLINALLSWVRPDPSNPIVMLLDRISDAVCAPIRRIMPTVMSGIDFAPFVAMLALQFIGRMFLVKTIADLASRM